MANLEIFTSACIAALYFTDTGDIDQPPSDAELNAETRADLEADCRSFWRRFGCYVEADICANVGTEGPIAQAGHDFWLTRNGHGAGFWDGEWPKVYADMLTEGAKGYGEFETYFGDDGEIYA